MAPISRYCAAFMLACLAHAAPANSGTVTAVPVVSAPAQVVGNESEPPTLSMPVTQQQFDEDTPVELVDMQVIDDSPEITVTVGTPDGRLEAGTAGSTTSVSEGSSWSATGPIGEVNQLLAGLVYVPHPDHNGHASVIFTITDDHPREQWQHPVLALTGRPVNDPPSSSAPATASAVEDEFLGLGGRFTADDPDAPGPQAMLNARLEVDHGRLYLWGVPGDAIVDGNVDGGRFFEIRSHGANVGRLLNQLDLRPDPDYHGPITLHYRVRDDAQATVERVVNITVAPRADIVDDAVVTREDAAVTFNVLADAPGKDGFTDPAATVVSASGAAHGSLAWQPDGRVVYTPDADFFGSDAFDYTVSAGGSTETGHVTVTATAVNDAPSFDALAPPPTLRDDAGAQILMIEGIVAGGGETQALTLTATSSNPAVVPHPQVDYTSPDPTGMIGFLPLQAGTATITVELSDDGGTQDGGTGRFLRSVEVEVIPSAENVFGSGFEEGAL